MNAVRVAPTGSNVCEAEADGAPSHASGEQPRAVGQRRGGEEARTGVEHQCVNSGPARVFGRGPLVASAEQIVIVNQAIRSSETPPSS